MTTQMPAIEERASRLEGAYEQVNERLGDLTQAIASLRSEMNSRFNTVYAFLATLVAANLGTLVAILVKG
ncbi:MAG: hypothetical protein OXE02_13470 [Chloroflexi bacterium]|nr:hypothetical protein [Chloroflexota bacterium]